MPIIRRTARLLLVPGVLCAGLPGLPAAAERVREAPSETQLLHRYGKPSERDRVWNVSPSQRDYDRDGLTNQDDWDDDGDGLIDEDED
jgi:hypothetical protein